VELNKVKRYVELADRKKRLQEELDAVSAEARPLEKEIIQEFEQTGVHSVKVDGATVFLYRQLWAKAKEGNYDRACEALAGAGLGSFVERRFNTHSISAYVREQEACGQDIPASIRDALEISETYSVRTRKA
jgi:hypothetical protein